MKDYSNDKKEAVDLGLSVKWASCNVGASDPNETGDYFAWGDPTGEKKSNNLEDYPTAIPPKEISGTEYDMARKNWGGKWRLPTEEECDELLTKCDVAFTGRGVTVTGPNGKSVFFAAAGRRDGYRFGQFGYYWTGTFNENNEAFSLFLGMDEDYEFWECVAELDRSEPISVRPVTE